MEDEIVYWIWLSKLKGLGPKRQRQLLKVFQNPKEIFDADIDRLMSVSGMNSKMVSNIKAQQSLQRAEEILKKCKMTGINMMTVNHEIYPKLGRKVEDMPILLYYKGNAVKDLEGNAIVGARRCSKNGKEEAISLAIKFSNQNIPVISGMAKGIDSYAHTACILNGGFTVAVLANGLDICYPSEHDILMKRIQENGLLLSEYEPGARPTKYTFPRRNRIIAACSKEIYVPESGNHSGALITAEYGRKYGRIVV